jgi:molecular chaperone HscB
MDESNTAMPADFLMLQMEWREALEDAKHARDLSALLDLSADIQQQAKQIKQDLQQSCEQQVWSQAASLVRELSFIDKILSDIQHTAEQF